MLATVLALQGEVVCQTSEQTAANPLRLGANPGSGTILRTSSDGRADLVLVPGALLQISGDSEVRIEQLLLTKDGNETEDGMRERVARVSLNRGSLTVVFNREDASELRFTVATVGVTLSADDNCVWRVRVEGGKTRMTCARGKASVSTGGSEPAVINAGYFCEWPGGAVRLATDDARAKRDLSEALDAEQRLRQLQQARLNRRPF